MHIKKTIETASGTRPECWIIGAVTLLSSTGNIRLTVLGYASNDARLEGKQPIPDATKEFIVEQEASTETAVGFDGGKYVELILGMSDALLSYLITLPEFAGGEIIS